MKISLLDCTLRDGGYINDWNFGEEAIKKIVWKLAQTGIEMIEVGFIKGDTYNPDYSLFPDVESFRHVLGVKDKNILYVGMLDMSNPVPIERLIPNKDDSIDGIRVIFKKEKLDEAYKYCQRIKELGYAVFVNFVSTDAYSDKEFIESIEKFNTIQPDGLTIVDTFGMIKRRHFLRLVALADNNLNRDTMLCYHAHNNLQQAFGNAETLVEMNLRRNVCIDACIFGMGRGAGNLNLELFAEYMNDNYGTNYRVSPMLEIMDEYLVKFYNRKFWGYSLPLYLSATHGCHPNYAIYLAEKGTLAVKAFNELLGSISPEDKLIFNKTKAEKYYLEYFEDYIDDNNTISDLNNKFQGKKILLIAPGKSINNYYDVIKQKMQDKEIIVIMVNYYDKKFNPEYIFCSNMRKYVRIPSLVKDKVIVTSNISDTSNAEYVVNYASYLSHHEEIIDNAGLMVLRVLASIGVKDVVIAGMDGYEKHESGNYSEREIAEDYFLAAELKNELISEELKDINKYISLEFITPTLYTI